MYKEEGMGHEEFEVLLDSSASADEVTAVREVFNDAGLMVTVRPSYKRKGVGDFPWIVIISAPLTAFLTAFAAAAGKGFYKELKKLVHSIRSKRTKTSGTRGDFIIIDSESGIWILLNPDIPEDAYRALAELDLDAFLGSGVLKYDNDEKEWQELT